MEKDLKMKGEFEKGCYNRNCSNLVSDFINHVNGKYYCLKCAVMINKFNKEFKAEHGFNQCEKVTIESTIN